MKTISQQTTDKNVDYIVDGITHVIKTFDTRAPGSKGERDAQEYFAKELANYADDVKIEEFKLHEASFMGWLYFETVFFLAALACLWFNLYIVTCVLIAVALFLFAAQLIFYKHVTAPFFKNKTSSNVYAVKKPEGEVKRRIVFCGHTDAAYEWSWLNIGGFPLFASVVFGALFSSLCMFGFGIASIWINEPGIHLIPAGGYRIALIVLSVISIPFSLALLHFSNRFKVVDGANDNLTANFAAISVLKTMKEEGISFENTEVCAMMAGSEEAGLRGAMAFAKAHKGEFDNPETLFVVLETLREPDHLTVYNRDMNGIVKVDQDACRLVQRAAKEAIGREIPLSTVTLGSTDSAALTKAGLTSTCLAALDHNLQPYYHTRKDSYDNLSKECLDLSYKICMKTLELYDKEGLRR